MSPTGSLKDTVAVLPVGIELAAHHVQSIAMHIVSYIQIQTDELRLHQALCMQ